jgi:CRISPR-associated endonuclease/helicase Cas3
MALTSETFESFFLRATGKRPYPYQSALAEEPIQNRLLHVPTGAGKTAAVVIAWLWRQIVDKEQTPRRLIYCLPMRVLVEQTRTNIEEWLGRIGTEIKVYTLMGADLEEEWESHPEAPAVLVGTQDMLLSRALNRGYGMSRYRWPLHFGLLNNDCLWIFDEIQLMGAGLPSSTQLAAFRENFSTFGPVASIWMSATLNLADMRSVDFTPHANSVRVTKPTAPDIDDPGFSKRLRAVKKLARAPASCRTPEGLAAFVEQNHQPGTQTLVVLNRVERARDTFDALAHSCRDTTGGPELLLLHSRFRPAERRAWQELLGQKPCMNGRIVVSTQVIEAGVDITSALLVTDLAPYSSLVQRFGRCNRNAEFEDAKIYWVDRPLTTRQAQLGEVAELDEKQKVEVALPYEWTELKQAESLVAHITSANPASLPPTTPATARQHVLRRRDLVDLFDTTRDLSGFDIDISRFVRGGEEHDVLVACASANSL